MLRILLMALLRQASCSLRLLLREQSELLARLSTQSLLESAQTPIYRQYAASCLSAQLQQGHRLLNDSSSWHRDANRGFHISLQGYQSAQAAALQQQEEEDNEPAQTQAVNDPACAVRKADVTQSKITALSLALCLCELYLFAPGFIAWCLASSDQPLGNLQFLSSVSVFSTQAALTGQAAVHFR